MHYSEQNVAFVDTHQVVKITDCPKASIAYAGSLPHPCPTPKQLEGWAKDKLCMRVLSHCIDRSVGLRRITPLADTLKGLRPGMRNRGVAPKS